MLQVQALSILTFTVGLSLTRPTVAGFRIHPPTAALAGAFLTIALGLITVPEAAGWVAFLSVPIATIVSLMMITLVAEEAGLFESIAFQMARWGGGRPVVLFSLLFFAGTLTGSVFTNDAAVLIFTPLVFGLVRDIQTDEWTRANRIPFYFAVLYVANLVGPLVISNPINIIVANWFDIGFVEYARWMVLPALVSILVTFAGLWLYFRRDFPTQYRIPEARTTTPAQKRFRMASVAVLGVTLAGFFSETWTGIPTVAVAAVGALALLIVNASLGSSGTLKIVRGVGWDVIVFLLGIFLVAAGLRASGATDFIGETIMAATEDGAAWGRTVTAFLAGGASAVLNNHPVADIMAFTIRDLPLEDSSARFLAMAALIGGDLGPKMLPIGSLAALMWFRMLRDRGVEIGFGEYVKIGVPVTLAAIFFSVLTLNWTI